MDPKDAPRAAAEAWPVEPRPTPAILAEAAALLEEEARAIFESNTTFNPGTTMKPASIVWDPEAGSLRARHARLLHVAAELRAMAKVAT
jgi:hypothetical protein